MFFVVDFCFLYNEKAPSRMLEGGLALVQSKVLNLCFLAYLCRIHRF
jgi:hypothetical protein